jgi:uroporphyrinogen-III synthase
MSQKIYLLSPVSYKETISLPMIAFSLTVSSLDISGYDLLMFTSKQAVKSAEALNPDWKNTPCLSIGNATTKQIEALGGNVAFCPDSFYAQTLSEEILAQFQDKHILYLRPKIVSFDAKTYLSSKGIKITEKVIYETKCEEYGYDKRPKQNAIIIFTSPSTIDCFFKNFIWDDSYRAVVIGESTKKYLPRGMRVYVSDEPLISSCVAKAKEILLSSNSK